MKDIEVIGVEKKLKEDNFTLKKLVNEVWGTHGGMCSPEGYFHVRYQSHFTVMGTFHTESKVFF